MIQVYTGNGKGKTTAAIGLAVRALGNNKRVSIVQFLKTPTCAESRILEKLKNIKIYSFGRRGLCYRNKVTKRDLFLAEKCFERARFLAQTIKPHILILDELNVALHLRLLEKREVIKFVKGISKKIEVVITGRYAPREIIEIADLVSEIKEVKHYYKRGIKSRKGIEY